MSALTDAETRPTARATAWRGGRPSEAECPVCGIEWRVYRSSGILCRHGPPTASCRGSYARVTPDGQAELATPPPAAPLPAAPGWTAADAQAVHDLYVAACAEQPGVSHSTLWGRAARSYYSQTGRVRAHGLSGYVTGCRCRICRQGLDDYKRNRDFVVAR